MGISKKLVTIICSIMMLTFCSAVAFAVEPEKTSEETKLKVDRPCIIVIKGADNIEAYTKAGVIRKCSQKIAGNDVLTQNMVRGTQIPTAQWDLNNRSRSFTYMFGKIKLPQSGS